MGMEFWKDWKRLTKLEKEAINSLKEAKKMILENIPKSEIIAIYIKGSLVRRELTKKSDIDTVTILKTNKYRHKLESLDELKYKYKPPLEFGSLSVWELKNNKHYIKSKKPRAMLDRFVKYINNYKLIYGKPLETESFSVRDDEENLKSLIKAFKKQFFKLYEKKQMGFSDIIKQVFWLTDLEQRVKGNNPPSTWKGLAKFVKNKNHIAHDALKYRLNPPTKGSKVRDKFILKLKKHLDKLEKYV